MKQLVKSKLKALPEIQQQQIMKLLENNPDFFMKIAGEIQQKVKQGQNEELAAMEVMKAHETDLRSLLS